ncbi:class I SAM-dependent methyltransferase [Nodularia chucula]|uniref:class I SAM-dependent methyltransferase n=1 Tax=Nodularia chucula TaxID=3093667 RepID=UPI0039C659E5
MNEQPYTQNFYQSQRAGSRLSAEAVVPLVIELTQPKSLVDIGCGVGTWLSVFQDFGIEDYLGIDGDYVDVNMLEIAPSKFICFDLKQPLEIERKFDLVVSLEVAEHLPCESAEIFIHSLTKLGNVVLFSAAIPHQGGLNHLNEQWPEYWGEIFTQYGYVAIDCLRRKIWSNEKVEPWYAQNLLIFVKESCLDKYPLLAREFDQGEHNLAMVHPKIYQSAIAAVKWQMHLELEKLKSQLET